MKKLFIVKDKDGKSLKNEAREVRYFGDKVSAKVVRDRLNGDGDAGFRVSRGPDHIGLHGNRNPRRLDKED